MTHRAALLARGLGSRMRAADPAAALDPAQARAADAGLKAMMPVNRRPFMDYLLSALADASLRDIALVVAPEHDAIRRHYMVDAPPSRVRLTFVVQQEARGTADAVLALEAWTGGSPFLVMNADNLYPSRALADLASVSEPALPVFSRDDLVRTSNIPPERVANFAVIELDETGHLKTIVEKPADLPAEAGSHGDLLVSMNCWRFDDGIFAACRDVPRSVRGEYELPEAVSLAVSRGMSILGLPARGPVLDLSRRGDAAHLARILADVMPRP